MNQTSRTVGQITQTRRGRGDFLKRPPQFIHYFFHSPRAVVATWHGSANSVVLIGEIAHASCGGGLSFFYAGWAGGSSGLVPDFPVVVCEVFGRFAESLGVFLILLSQLKSLAGGLGDFVDSAFEADPKAPRFLSRTPLGRRG